jgi:hypothetical protein
MVSILSEKIIFIFLNKRSFSTFNGKEVDYRNGLGRNGLNKIYNLGEKTCVAKSTKLRREKFELQNNSNLGVSLRG